MGRRGVRALCAVGITLAVIVAMTIPAVADDHLGSISGTVRDTVGQPIEGVAVCVSGENAFECRFSGADGTYTVASLPEGDYQVSFEGNAVGFADQYYDGVDDFSEATAVFVGPGAHVTGIDAGLAPLGSIAGRVTDADGQPIEGVDVCAQGQPSGSSRCGTTDVDGAYTVPNLRAEEHIVQFDAGSAGYFSEYYDDVQFPWDAMLVAVGPDEHVTGIDATLTKMATVSGTVTDLAGAPIPDVTVCSHEQTTSEEACATTDFEGAYTITGVREGEHIVRFDGRSMEWVLQYYDGVDDEFDATPVLVDTGENVVDIDAHLRRECAGGTWGNEDGAFTGGENLGEDGLDAHGLATALAGEGVTVVADSATWEGSCHAGGLFTGGGGIIGFDDGILMSSGAVAGVVGPNDSSGYGRNNGRSGDEALTALGGDPTMDAAVLEFDFTVAEDRDEVSFTYVFGSDEYNEYVEGGVNDVFAFWVNDVNCAVVAGGDPVSINTINAGRPGIEPTNPAFFVNNDHVNADFSGEVVDQELLRDTQMDGYTRPLTCSADVEPGSTNTIRLAIADGGDSILDSWVLLQAGSLSTDLPPTAHAQTVETQAETPVDITLTGTDPEGAALTFAIVDGPTNGSLSGTAPNVTYTPDTGFTGPDTFTFTVNDGALTSSPATVTVNVADAPPTNNPPVADGQHVVTDEDVAVGITLTGSDPDGDPITFAVDEQPTNGNLSGTAPNLTYTPHPGFFGADSFTFTVNDGDLTSAPATVTIDVVEAPPPPATGSITGTVTDTAGDPIAGVLVMAYRDGDVWVGSHGAYTAADGTYTISGLATDSYAVFFYTAAPLSYVAQWWNDSATRAGAELVAVAEGEVIPEVDATLVGAGSISGTVTDDEGTPIEGAVVWAYRDTDSWVGTAAATTAADGTYTITGLPTGAYRVMVVSGEGQEYATEWWDDSISRAGATPIVVGAAGSVTGIDAELADAAVITGTVTDAAGDPVAGVEVWAYSSTDTWVGTAATTTAADGTYKLLAPAGVYRILFRVTDGSGLANEWWHDSPTRGGATVLVVGWGSRTNDIDAVLGSALVPI